MTKKTFLLNFILLFSFMISCEKDDNKTSDDSKKLYIGVLLPLDTSDGLNKNSLQIAIDEINNGGGIADGYQLKLDVRSSEPPADISREEYAKLIALDVLKEHPNNLIGFITAWSSSSRGLALGISDSLNIPQIAGLSTSDANTDISNYFQRLSPPDKFQSALLVEKALNYGYKKIAIAIQEGDVYSENLAIAFKEKFIEKGGIILDEIKFTAQDVNLSSKIIELYDQEPDAVFLSMLDLCDDFLYDFNSNAVSLGLDVKKLNFIFSDQFKMDNVLKKSSASLIAGEINNHPKTYGASSFPDKNNLVFKHLEHKLKSKYNEDIRSWNAQFYDIPYLFAMSIEKAFLENQNLKNLQGLREDVNTNIRLLSKNVGSDTKVNSLNGWQKIKSQMAQSVNLDFEGASGNCDIDENGDVITNYDVFTVKVDENNEMYFHIIENLSPTK